MYSVMLGTPINLRNIMNLAKALERIWWFEFLWGFWIFQRIWNCSLSMVICWCKNCRIAPVMMLWDIICFWSWCVCVWDIVRFWSCLLILFTFGVILSFEKMCLDREGWPLFINARIIRLSVLWDLIKFIVVFFMILSFEKRYLNKRRLTLAY